MDARSPEEKRQAVVFHARFEYQAQQFWIDGSNELWTGDPFDLPKGVEPKMDARRRWEFWRDVLPRDWTDAQVDAYQYKHWCGGFALFCVKAAGLAPDVAWRDAIGFVEPHRLPKVKIPQPGDVAWFIQNQHYAIVERVRGNEFDSIDGNQGTVQSPCIKLRSRLLTSVKFFYSIQPFIEATGAAA
jgi:hypothetical protein